MRSAYCETSNNLDDFWIRVVHILHNAEFSGHLLCDPAVSFPGRFAIVGIANLLCWACYALLSAFPYKGFSLQSNRGFSQLYYIITDKAISFVLVRYDRQHVESSVIRDCKRYMRKNCNRPVRILLQQMHLIGTGLGWLGVITSLVQWLPLLLLWLYVKPPHLFSQKQSWWKKSWFFALKNVLCLS